MFQGRRRLFICWVKRVSLGETQWDPLAFMSLAEAHDEKQRALRAGDLAHVDAYIKAKGD